MLDFCLLVLLCFAHISKVFREQSPCIRTFQSPFYNLQDYFQPQTIPNFCQLDCLDSQKQPMQNLFTEIPLPADHYNRNTHVQQGFSSRRKSKHGKSELWCLIVMMQTSSAVCMCVHVFVCVCVTTWCCC